MTNNVDLPLLIENGLGAPQSEITNLGRRGTKFPLNLTAEEFHAALIALFPAVNLINYQICRAGVSKRLSTMTGKTPSELKGELASRSTRCIYLVPDRKITSTPDALLYNRKRSATPVNGVVVTPPPEPQAQVHPEPQVGVQDDLLQPPPEPQAQVDPEPQVRVQDDLLQNPPTICPTCHRTDVTASGCQFCMLQQALEQSLEMDRAREQRAIREAEQLREARELSDRAEQIRNERRSRSSVFVGPSNQEGFTLRIRTDRNSLTGQFRESDSLSDLMDLIGSEDEATSQFYVSSLDKRILCCVENASKTLGYFGIVQNEVLNVNWITDETPTQAPSSEVTPTQAPSSEVVINGTSDQSYSPQNEPIRPEDRIYIPSVILRPPRRTSALNAANFISAVAHDTLPELRPTSSLANGPSVTRGALDEPAELTTLATGSGTTRARGRGRGRGRSRGRGAGRQDGPTQLTTLNTGSGTTRARGRGRRRGAGHQDRPTQLATQDNASDNMGAAHDSEERRHIPDHQHTADNLPHRRDMRLRPNISRPDKSLLKLSLTEFQMATREGNFDLKQRLEVDRNNVLGGTMAIANEINYT
ncbi:uncharacterized protein LOC135493880 [Lineus longissimus]|uniref:uncharacterized protein LOC135493880 n=1 Tax=Lineus longissimus TaxID=88925 RepID=UPI002B4DB67F